MTDWATAAASHDLMLADPPDTATDCEPAGAPNSCHCSQCGVDEVPSGETYCSQDCAFDAGVNEERTKWRARVAFLLELAETARYGPIQTHWPDVPRLYHAIEELQHA